MIISFTGIDNIIMLYSCHPVLLYYTCMLRLLLLHPVYSPGIIFLLLPVKTDNHNQSIIKRQVTPGEGNWRVPVWCNVYGGCTSEECVGCNNSQRSRVGCNTIPKGIMLSRPLPLMSGWSPL